MSVLELIGAKDQVKDAKCENPEATTVNLKAVADSIICGTTVATTAQASPATSNA